MSDEEKLKTGQTSRGLEIKHYLETLPMAHTLATCSPNLMLGLLVGCLKNPKNADKFISEEGGQVKHTDFLEFILDAIALVSIAVDRQLDNFNLLEGDEYSSALAYKAHILISSALNDLRETYLGKPVDDKDPFIIDADGLIRCLDLFVAQRMSDEEAIIICQLAEGWQTFLNKGSDYANYCADNDIGALMKITPTDPFQLHLFFRVASPEEIEETLHLQAQIAAARGNNNYAETREKIRQILEAYSGIMEPEIMQFRWQASRVVRRKRDKHSRDKSGFLMSTAKILKDTDNEERVPKAVLEKMANGSFGQQKGENGIYSATTEHTKTIAGGGIVNFPNLSIVNRLINHDMNTLVKFQREAMRMKRDKVINHNGWLELVELGDIFPVIVMRLKRNEIGYPLPYLAELPESILNGPWRTDQERAQIKLGFIDPK